MPSTVRDVKMTGVIQDDLARRGLIPEIQLIDQGHMEIDRMDRANFQLAADPESACYLL